MRLLPVYTLALLIPAFLTPAPVSAQETEEQPNQAQEAEPAPESPIEKAQRMMSATVEAMVTFAKDERLTKDDFDMLIAHGASFDAIGGNGSDSLDRHFEQQFEETGKIDLTAILEDEDFKAWW